ncbi:sensor histidine kinase [Peribacillus cavernae]|uniref:histidine kinase n=1 Tax=Peribacillus cavernae TaxID=1674310 RepID=A0A433HWJ2_9BACI|nr:sensor histidine kinase [Peribacillus cavernae]MDQ0218126.1 sensor histidine kinase YesM [Peribacillus cavernae]RUQ32720.1 sensor histidine kinase [Peribacillus cavernae]
MKTIRTKLLLYFFVFVVLFNVVSISIYFSSRSLLSEYDASFERFLLLNQISQTSNLLYEKTNAYVVEKNQTTIGEFHKVRRQLDDDLAELQTNENSLDPVQLQKYINTIKNFVQECEITIGLVIRDDIDQYTKHLKEARTTSSYLKETTLDLIDLELTDYQSFFAEMEIRNESFKWFTLFLFNTTVLLAISFALWFSRGINRPIQSLSKAAQEISTGKFDGQAVQIESNDELKLLGNSFNTMRDNIRQYIIEIEEKSELDRLFKDLELKHLQNQINPHFLFNTLNTVSRMAYLEDAKETSRLIDSVSALLRYSLGDNNKSVLLREEVNVVTDYFYIQQTRFGDRITFQKHVEADCLDIDIPSLTLQPLVENAFIHGVEGKEEGGEISLYIYKEGQNTIVEITDNGTGMTQEQIAALLTLSSNRHEPPHVGHSTGLGLKNVIRRLQLFYQSEHVIEICSAPGQGTSIKLIVPVKGDSYERNDR